MIFVETIPTMSSIKLKCEVVMWPTNLWYNIACKSIFTSGGINLLLVTRCDYCQHVEDTSSDVCGQRVDFLFTFGLRAALHYGGEVHRSVKNFSPKHGYLRQRMVCRRRWEDNKLFSQVGVLWRSSLLSEALRLPKKLDLRRTPPSRKCRHVGNHVSFSYMYKVLHQMTLGCNVNHHQTRVSPSANQILESPIIHDRWTSPS